MSQKYKCNYCKKYFDDLCCLDNPEREICEECLEKHPRLKNKWKNQYEQFIRGVQNFNKASARIISDILFQTIKDGRSTGQELAQSFGRAIPPLATGEISKLKSHKSGDHAQ